MREIFGAMRLYIVISAIAFWLGGFTFYAGVAVPMGVEVLGGHRTVGFITQRVTNWLNVAGVAALAIFFWNYLLSRRFSGKLLRRTMLITLLVMTLVEVELIIMHPIMDRQLVTEPHRDILDEDRFEILHHVYLISTTVQWAMGMLHIWCICIVWRRLNLPGPTIEIAKEDSAPAVLVEPRVV